MYNSKLAANLAFTEQRKRVRISMYNKSTLLSRPSATAVYTATLSLVRRCSVVERCSLIGLRADLDLRIALVITLRLLRVVHRHKVCEILVSASKRTVRLPSMSTYKHSCLHSQLHSKKSLRDPEPSILCSLPHMPAGSPYWPSSLLAGLRGRSSAPRRRHVQCLRHA